MAFTATNVTFAMFCCIHQPLNSVEVIEVAHLINSTAHCFKNVYVSTKNQIDIILQVFGYKNSTFSFSEDACLLATTTGPDYCTDSTKATSAFYVLFWLLILLFTFSMNLTVIYAIFNVSYLRSSVTNFFIASLAVSDALVSLCILPVKIKFALNNLRFCSSESACRFYLTADHTFFSASILNLLVIAVDRYIALMYPYKYPHLITNSRARIVIALVWLSALVCGASVNVKWDDPSDPAILISRYQCVNKNLWYITVVYIVVFYIPIIVMGIIYFRILKLATLHAKSIAKYTYNNSGSAREMKAKKNKPEYGNTLAESKPIGRYGSKKKKSDANFHAEQCRKMVLKATKTVAAVFGTFVICWIPVSVISLTESWCKGCVVNDLRWRQFLFVFFVEVLPVFNSMLNPLIYAFMNTFYKKAIKEVLSKLVPHRWINDSTKMTMSTVSRSSLSLEIDNCTSRVC